MLARLLPGPLVRWFARPYLAGDSVEAALEVGERLWRDRGVRTTFDLLGENVAEPAEVESSVATYQRLIAAVAADARFARGPERPSVSVKPSAFTTGEIEAARGPLESLAAHARERDVALTIDMEDHRWTDFTIDLSVDLFEAGHDVGTVLQTRLHRTEADLERIPQGMRLRLVIGIYPEPAKIALTRKVLMKERMVTFARRLLERNVFVEFATHDVAFVERFVTDVVPHAPGCCEVQMLLGVPRPRLQRRLLARGLPVRLYVPFANGWDDATAYLRRRMEESPNITWLVLRNLFSAGR